MLDRIDNDGDSILDGATPSASDSAIRRMSQERVEKLAQEIDERIDLAFQMMNLTADDVRPEGMDDATLRKNLIKAVGPLVLGEPDGTRPTKIGEFLMKAISTLLVSKKTGVPLAPEGHAKPDVPNPQAGVMHAISDAVGNFTHLLRSNISTRRAAS